VVRLVASCFGGPLMTPHHTASSERDVIALLIENMPHTPTIAGQANWSKCAQEIAVKIIAARAPSPSSALATAEKALISAREDILSMAHSRWSEIETSDEEMTAEIDAALAAIKAEASR
jgi:hypothetical protein